MRPDMEKILTERPRTTARVETVKTGLRMNRYDPERDYDFPYRLPISRRRQYGYKCKQLTDRLFPLLGYLRKWIGRPWDQIYSEVRHYLPGNTLQGRHIMRHIDGDVEQDCFIGADSMVHRAVYRGGGLVEGLYVHPITKTLEYIEKTRYKHPVETKDIIKLDSYFFLKKYYGIWYRGWYEYTADGVRVNLDLVREKDLGEALILVKCREIRRRLRQLGKKELRKRGLKNGR